MVVSAPSVVLTDLELRHFRNLGAQTLRFPPEGVAVVGDNGQGKSNLLEAIYYLESFRSFRGAGDAEMTAFSEDVFHLKGSVVGSRPATVSAGFDRRRKRKKVTVDGNEAPRLWAALGRLGAVVFSPADAELVSGGPDGRRRFLNVLLSLNRTGYVEALQGYRKALAQRNAALKAGAAREAVRAWDDLLVDRGAQVVCMRREWVSRWAGPFAAYCEAISGRRRSDAPGGCAGAMAYKPNLGDAAAGAASEDPDDPSDASSAAEAVRRCFRKRLEQGWETDLARRTTCTGPHRDDLVFMLESGGRRVPARAFGSGGQRRTLALALRLAEAATIRRQRKTEPLLLLDDAFAELDPGRSDRVLALMEAEAPGQVILTAPKESDVRLRSMSLARWRIRNGVVEA